MPYSIIQDKEHYLVFGRFTGVIDDPAYSAYFDEIEALAPFDARYNLVLIIEDDVQWMVDTHLVREYARRVQTFDDNALRIMVVNNPLSHGLTRVFTSSVEGDVGDRYRIVKNLSEAAVTLGMDEQLFTKIAETGSCD